MLHFLYKHGRLISETGIRVGAEKHFLEFLMVPRGLADLDKIEFRHT